MRISELINLTYFSLLTLLALLWPLSLRSRTKTFLAGLAGLGLTALGSLAPDVVRDWVPVPLMVLAYWQSGFFFQKPNPALQAWFERSEGAILNFLRIDPNKWS